MQQVQQEQMIKIALIQQVLSNLTDATSKMDMLIGSKRKVRIRKVHQEAFYPRWISSILSTPVAFLSFSLRKDRWTYIAHRNVTYLSPSLSTQT